MDPRDGTILREPSTSGRIPGGPGGAGQGDARRGLPTVAAERYPHASGGQRGSARAGLGADAPALADRGRRAGVRLDVSIQAQILNLMLDPQREHG